MANFKKVGDIAFVEAVTENDSILIEREGTLKKAKAEGIGGGKRNVTVLLDTPTYTQPVKEDSYQSSLLIEGLADYFAQGKTFKLRVISTGYVEDMASSSEVEIVPTIHAGSWLVAHGGGRGRNSPDSIGTVYSYYSVNPEGTLTFYHDTNVSPRTYVSILRIEVETYE